MEGIFCDDKKKRNPYISRANFANIFSKIETLSAIYLCRNQRKNNEKYSEPGAKNSIEFRVNALRCSRSVGDSIAIRGNSRKSCSEKSRLALRESRYGVRVSLDKLLLHIYAFALSNCFELLQKSRRKKETANGGERSRAYNDYL